MRATNEQLVLETMVLNSGQTFLARDVAYYLETIYDRCISSKSASKILLKLEDDYNWVNRRTTTKEERGIYNCRYIYLWGWFEDIERQQEEAEAEYS